MYKHQFSVKNSYLCNPPHWHYSTEENISNSSCIKLKLLIKSKNIVHFTSILIYTFYIFIVQKLFITDITPIISWNTTFELSSNQLIQQPLVI